MKKEQLNLEALGQKVREYRNRKGYTVEKLSDLADVSKSHINNIESANSSASVEVLVRIANALEVSVDMLLGDSLSQKPRQAARVAEYGKVMEDCSEPELKVILNTAKALKESLRKELE